MRDPDSNVLEFVAGCAVDADIYYLAARIGPGHECYDPDPGPPSRMFFYQHQTEEKWFYHDLSDWQVESTIFIPEQQDGRARRVLALDYYGQLEDLARAGTTCEYISHEGDDFSGGLTRIRQLGEDLFCCGVHGMIYHRSETGWKQVPTHFPAPDRGSLKDDLESIDFDNWLGCVGHLFELDGVPPLPADPAERDAELRRRFEESRTDLAQIGKNQAFEQLLAELDLASVNDLCGTGFTDLYAIGSDGLIAHWDGAAWNIPEPITSAELLHASRTDSGELFLVGTEATILMGQINTGFTPIPHQISPEVPFYCACRYGQAIYIGSENGLYLYSPNSGVVERLKAGIPEELMDAAINDISSADGVLWVLTPWDLIRFDGTVWQVIVHPDNG
ncbi:hypothetical protein [Stenotrophomonas sp. SMYL11]|uniref:hypothetical protein n=1 Tax=Stenotrophomonas sp. SMYL11 TaxID=3076042 RepID=UPI002E7A896C|nr:hypothetical protein [Stenotrophomonas sp. SMYL11]